MQVYIVEDDAVVQSVLNAYLAHYGADHGEVVDVCVQPDARQALSELLERGEDFDAIFLDVHLPRVGGDEIYSRLMEANPGLLGKVVFITGYRSDLTTRFPALKLNILDKPFRYRQLQEAMAGITG